MKYLAYFQSYTNTYGNEPQLISLYEEALNHPSVAGLIIGTRPDCMPDTLLNYFEKSAQKHFLIIEYGMESALDKTLVRINRGHTHMDTENAIRRTANRGILTGAHLILGLPGETREDMLNHARIISKLPLATLKLHQLQLIRYTKMAEEYALSPEQFHFPTIDEYIDLVIDFVELLSPNIALERFVSQSPAHLLIAPNWKLKNHVIADKVDKRMEERNTRQGKLYSNK